MKIIHTNGLRHLVHALLIGLMLALVPAYQRSAHAQGCSATLSFGGSVLCTLAAAAEVDQFSFTAEAGDVVIIRTSRTGGNLQPRIRLRNSEGVLVREAFSYSIIAEMEGVALANDDTYTLSVEDRQGTGTGAYAVSLQRLNGPAGVAALNYGAAQPSTLLLGSEMDAYSLSGQAGDKLLLRMSSGASRFSPQLRLYQPDGTLTCSASSYGNTAGNSQVCQLPVSGTYLLLANEWREGEVGSYYVFVQRLNNPAGASPISYGTATIGSLAMPAEADSFTVDGTTGGVVTIRMARASENIQPVVQLYTPDGTLVCSSYSYGQVTEKNDCLLPQTGRYTVLAYDLQEGRTGSYGVFVQRLNAPEQTANLSIGSPNSGQISIPGELQSYTFTGTEGEVVLARVAAAQGFSPVMNVYGPEGIGVCGGYSYGTVAEAGPCILPADGRYSLLIGDFDDARTGTYTLHLQSLTEPVNDVPLAFGQTTTSTLSTAGQLDTFTFIGNAEAKLRVRVVGGSQSIDPSVRLYSPDGVSVCSAATYSTTIETGDCLLPADGRYTLIVNDYDGADTGSYTVLLTCLVESCGPAPDVKRIYLPLLQW